MFALLKLLHQGDPQFFKEVRNHSSYDVLWAMATIDFGYPSFKAEAQLLLDKVKNKTPMNLDLEVESIYVRRYLDVVFGKR